MALPYQFTVRMSIKTALHQYTNTLNNLCWIQGFVMKHCVVLSHCNEVNINFISDLHLALVYILTDTI